MSEAVKGVISDLKFYYINKDQSPNEWGKTHRAKATINGTIYDMGQVKPSPRGEVELRVQHGKDWVTLLPGDEVQFFAKSKESKGKTYWDKEGKVQLVKKGNGVAAPAPSAGSAASGPSSSAPRAGGDPYANPDAMQIRIEDGQVFNCIVSLLSHTPEHFTPETVGALAPKVRAALAAFRAAGCGRAQPVTQTSSPAPAAQPSAVQPAAAEFDEDDIPF